MKNANLVLSMSGHKGQFVGFFHSGGNPMVKGFWEHKDGSEGGELLVNCTTAEVEDFDGAYDLPSYVKYELQGLGLSIPWD